MKIQPLKTLILTIIMVDEIVLSKSWIDKYKFNIVLYTPSYCIMYYLRYTGCQWSPRRVIKRNEMKPKKLIRVTLYLYLIITKKLLIYTIHTISGLPHICAVGGAENVGTIFNCCPSIGQHVFSNCQNRIIITCLQSSVCLYQG